MQLIILYLPGSSGYALRYRYWQRRLRFLGTNVRIEPGVHFQNPNYISIGDDCWIDRNVIIIGGINSSKREKKYLKNERFCHAKGEVFIGKSVHIAPGVIISGIGGISIGDYCGISSGSKLYSLSHHYRSFQTPAREDIFYSPMVSHENQAMIEGPIFIGMNVGLALNAIVLPGSIIEDRSFVALNSVVKSSFPSNSFISGNPAQRLKTRFGDRD